MLIAGAMPTLWHERRLTAPELSNVRTAIALTSLWLAALLFFFSLPGMDIAASRAFFSAKACAHPTTLADVCGVFPLSQQENLAGLRKALFYLPALTALWLLWLLIEALQHHGATYDGDKVRKLSLSLLAFVLGPGLLVNVFLKSFSNRPRPRETDLFGGDLAFQPAGDFSGACTDNCSFISGEAAGAGWLVCLLVFLSYRRRSALYRIVIVVGVLTPSLRLMFGGHYLSDVVLGWLSSAAVFACVFAAADLWNLRTRRAEMDKLPVAKSI
ncbi:phosphatase PAP2 family protein [Pseudomonas sp. R2.Fl]|nr:phosphatase PAP2 family protein [Pseudomonas sp. R2.Fl]